MPVTGGRCHLEIDEPACEWRGKNNWKSCERMGLNLEKWYPRLAGVAAGATAYFFMPAPVEGMKEVVQSIVNTSAISVGFLATSLSILYSLGKNRIMSDLAKLGRTDHIVNYFIESIISWFALAVIGSILLLVDYRPTATIPQWGNLLLILMWSVLVWAIATLIRIVTIFRSILLSP